jgi:uncharacterized membrane protein
VSSAMSPAYEIGIVTFGDIDGARRVVEGLREAGAIGLTNEVGIVEHHGSGKFTVHGFTAEKTKGERAGEGAIVGALAGALVLGPFGLLGGLIGGALVGRSMGGADPHDLQLSDDFMRRLEEALPPGSSAVLIVGEPEVVDQLIGEIKATDAVTKAELREPLTDAQAARIREAIEQHRAKG